MHGAARLSYIILAVLSGTVIAMGSGWLAWRGKAQAGTRSAPATHAPAAAAAEQGGDSAMDDSKLDAMKAKLSAEQYNVCFLKGTEAPFSGKYYKTKDPGEYHCTACDSLLFYSDTKFDSGSGWPSFWDEALPGAIGKVEDRSHGMLRTEVTCANCGAHLGHVFDDGPAPTGQRYCINSLSLEFKPSAERQPAQD